MRTPAVLVVGSALGLSTGLVATSAKRRLTRRSHMSDSPKGPDIALSRLS